MLTQRTVGYLGTITLAVSIAAAVAVIDRNAGTVSSDRAETVFTELDDLGAKVEILRISKGSTAGPKTVTVKRKGDGWVVSELSDYPARSDFARKLLFELAALKTVEPKTKDPARHGRLELATVEDKASKAMRVEVIGGGKTLFDAHLGRNRPNLAGGSSLIYVRRTTDDQTWLAQGDIDLNDRPAQWVETKLFDVSSKSVTKVTLTSPAGEAMVLQRDTPDARHFNIVDEPSDREIRNLSVVDNVASVPTRLLMESVRPLSELDFDGNFGKAVFEVKGGLVLTFDFAVDEKNEKRFWARIVANTTEGATDKARTFAETITKTTAGWAYDLGGIRTERLRETLESMTVEKKKKSS
ncbi:MAG: DUF4340 domain-containing protein [Rhodospirillaceae bacterium]|nr:DUF4340 domain-containing protein [Rhodospirillaceae bacterium]